MKTMVGSNLERVLAAGHFAVTAEVGPPRGPNPEAILKKAKAVKGIADAYNVTDNQTPVVRMSSIAASRLLLEFGSRESWEELRMGNDAFLRLSMQDRREAMGVAANRSGRPAHLLEKDVWVVWTLAALYGSAIGEHLVLKGGTSLSKAYRVIRRFSERDARVRGLADRRARELSRCCL